MGQLHLEKLERENKEEGVGEIGEERRRAI